MHVEGDATLDRNLRHQQGLQGSGVSVTLIYPDGEVDGVSVDYPDIKRFEPNDPRKCERQRTHAA